MEGNKEEKEGAREGEGRDGKESVWQKEGKEETDSEYLQKMFVLFLPSKMKNVDIGLKQAQRWKRWQYLLIGSWLLLVELWPVQSICG